MGQAEGADDMYANHAIAIVAGVMLMMPALGAAQQATGTTAQDELSERDRSFVEEAASSNQFEIRSSELVLESLGDDQDMQDIRDFAQRMVSDHEAAGRDLSAIAESKGMTVTQELNSEHASMMEELEGQEAAGLAPTYLQQQVTAHQEAVELFERQASEGENPELRQFAERTLPTLEQHLEMARNIQSGTGIAETGTQPGQPAAQQ